MTNNPLNLRFTYVPDQTDPNRVLTIARQKLNEREFKISWAVNNPDGVKVPEAKTFWDKLYRFFFGKGENLPPDTFKKSIGRSICESRIICGKCIVIYVPPDEYIVEQALIAISSSSSRPANRIARDELDWIREEEDFCNQSCLRCSECSEIDCDAREEDYLPNPRLLVKYWN